MTIHNGAYREPLGVDYIQRNDSIVRWGLTISSFLAIPGLVGFWPMSSVQRSTGNCYDLSGQGRTLTYNGGGFYQTHNSIVPFINLDGVDDYLSRADETDLDILGTETIFLSTSRGLTLGGWFWFDTLSDGSQTIGMAEKFRAAGNQRSYSMFLSTTNVVGFVVSVDGITQVQANSTTVSAGGWYFAAARFLPSSEVSVYLNGTSYANTTGVPASIFNSTAPFEIGRFNGGTYLDGRAALVFLSARYVPSQVLNLLYYQSRVVFGV